MTAKSERVGMAGTVAARQTVGALSVGPGASRHQAARRASPVSRTLLRGVIASSLDVGADGRRRR